MIASFQTFFVACLIGGLLLIGVPCSYADPSDQPLNQTPADTGDIMLTRLIQGHVSHQAGKYILGPGDVIEIKVQDLNEYDQRFEIRPDGYVSIHPFGEYRISGLELEGLEAWLEEKFKFYLLKPKVTVNVAELRPAIIYVFGAVRRPGTYQFIRESLSNSVLRDERSEKVDLTITNILSRAGGVLDNADIQNITVEHTSAAKQAKFNLLELLANGEGEDIILMPGDKIVIPELKERMTPETFKLVSRSTYFKDKFPVVILGSVQNQGEVLVDVNNNSLNAAIALAGGFTNGSRKNNVIVQHPTKDGSYEKTVIDRENIPMALQPGDIVYVSEKNIAKVQRVLSLITSIAQNIFYGTTVVNTLDLMKARNR